MKKRTKIIAGIGAFVLIGVILFFASAFVGNPVSKFMANRSGKAYIEETYPDMELERDKAVYSFKDGDYYVRVKSPTSIDTHFSLSITSTGRVRRDSYEDDVLSKFNTWRRVDREYRDMVSSVFQSVDFPYDSKIGYGGIKLKEKDLYNGFGASSGLSLEELELDKIYDIKELGRKSGDIVITMEDEQVNVERASEVLINIKDFFDQKDVPFYVVDFSLEEPKTEDKVKFEDRERVDVGEFLYSDIYEEGLIERLEKSAKDLQDYYEKEDSKKMKRKILKKKS